MLFLTVTMLLNANAISRILLENPAESFIICRFMQKGYADFFTASNVQVTVQCNNGWVFMLFNAKFILLDITRSCHALQFVYQTHVRLGLIIPCLSVYPWL